MRDADDEDPSAEARDLAVLAILAMVALGMALHALTS